MRNGIGRFVVSLALSVGVYWAWLVGLDAISRRFFDPRDQDVFGVLAVLTSPLMYGHLFFPIVLLLSYLGLGIRRRK